MELPKISLEQWAALKAVVEEGSYSKAADVLNKSQSTVSYAIAKIEEQLPVQVLRQEGRRAVLTDAGQIIYRKAVEALTQAAEVEKTAALLAEGWETEISIAVDVIADIDPLLWAFEAVAKVSPLTRLRMFETSLSGTEEMLLERKVSMAVTAKVPTGFMGKKLSPVLMIPVAHKHHPLANLKKIDEPTLKKHRQIVLRDSGVKRTQDSGWLGSEQRWTVSHFQTAIDVVRRGLGFAFVPKAAARDLLKSGELVKLDLVWQDERSIMLYLVPASTGTNGPACKLLMQEIISRYQNMLSHS